MIGAAAKPDRRRLSLGLSMLATAAAGLAIVAGLLAMIASPFEITRVRNSLIAQEGEPGDFDWQPVNPPGGFLMENQAPPEAFAQALAAAVASGAEEGAWARSLSLARHLALGPGPGESGIRADTETAYRAIMSEPRGYCADYSQVFNGLAATAGVPVREWGMSFDGFSGDGHSFNEIYDRALGGWVFIDSFYSLYVTERATGRPLSVMALMGRLREGATETELEVHPIDEGQFAFGTAARALEYYRRGSDQLFLWFGNNVFSYDAHPLVRSLGPVSRALEQGVAILAGVHPDMYIVPTATNSDVINGLRWRRWLFLGGAAALVPLTLAFLLLWRALRRTRRARSPRVTSIRHSV